MVNIRDSFHEVGNWHNKISIAAGLAKAVLKNKTNPSPQDIEEIMSLLESIEKNAIGADKILIKLKEDVYGIINPDTGGPKSDTASRLPSR